MSTKKREAPTPREHRQKLSPTAFLVLKTSIARDADFETPCAAIFTACTQQNQGVDQ